LALEKAGSVNYKIIYQNVYTDKAQGSDLSVGGFKFEVHMRKMFMKVEGHRRK